MGITTSNFWFSDKERYEREQKQLESHSATLRRPKKCLSAYMIFVKEVSILVSNSNFVDAA